jgi:hypothetical protein
MDERAIELLIQHTGEISSRLYSIEQAHEGLRRQVKRGVDILEAVAEEIRSDGMPFVITDEDD